MYATGSPLMLTGNLYWKRFLNVLRPAYTPPTRHALSTNLLDAEFNRVQVKVKQIIEKGGPIGSFRPFATLGTRVISATVLQSSLMGG
jgi:hypothetical protein